MEETRIQYNTAVLSKKKGFNIPVPAYYSQEGKLIINFEDSGYNESEYYFDANSFNENWNDGRRVNDVNNSCYGCNKGSYKPVYSAPTQSLLQKFLREVHNIHIEINLGHDQLHIWYDFHLYKIEKSYNYTPIGQSESELKTYEAALEQALITGLNLIK